jgi:hypothetical protein
VNDPALNRIAVNDYRFLAAEWTLLKMPHLLLVVLVVLCEFHVVVAVVVESVRGVTLADEVADAELFALASYRVVAADQLCFGEQFSDTFQLLQ